MDEIIKRDQNTITVAAGITDDSNQYIRMLRVDPSTGRLKVSATGGGGGAVSSVFGRTGAVIAVSGDYNTDQVTEATNLYFTNARAISAVAGVGYVVGPATATDNAIARFDLTTGRLIKNSGVTIDSSNNVVSAGTFNAGGSTAVSTTYFNTTLTGTIVSGTVGNKVAFNRTDAGGGTITGFRSDVLLAGAVTSFNMIGLNFGVGTSISGATLSNGQGLQGNVTNVSGATFTTATGGIFGMVNQGTGTTWKGIDVSITNSGTLTDTYGIYIGDVTSGTQTNTAFGLYQVDTNAYNYFGGRVGFGTTTPADKVEIVGNLSLRASSGVAETSTGINISHTNGTGTSRYRISQDEGDYLQVKRTGDTTGDGDVYTIMNLVSPQAATTADSESTLSLTTRAGGGVGLNETRTLDVYNDQYSRDNGMGMRQLFKNSSANPIRFEFHDKTTNNGATTYSGCTIVNGAFTFVYTSFAGVTPTVGDWVWDNAGTYFQDDTKITAVDLGTKTITFNKAATASGSGLSFRGKNIKEAVRMLYNSGSPQTLFRKYIPTSSSNVIEVGGQALFDGDVSVPDEAFGSSWNGSLEVPTKNALYDKFIGSQLPTIIVAASGGDVTTIQAALDLAASTYAQGCKIYLTDDSYTITTGLLVKSNNVIIEGNNQAIEVDGNVVATLFKTNSAAAGYEGFALRNLRLIQTNASALGVCIDASDMALQKHDNLVIYFFATGIKMLDTQNITFYNRFANIKLTQIGSVGINIDSHTGNPVNDNMFDNIRCSYAASGIGVLIDNAQSNNFYNCNFEPSSNSGTFGVKLVDTNGDSTFDNSFYGVYIEANATGISVGSGVARTSFFAGEVVENTANLSDSGTDTGFFNTDIGYVVKNQVTQLTARQIINTNNAITATGNAATVPITSRITTVTNNSAATLTITLTTASAVDGQQVMVRVLDFSAATQTLTWVNTENSQTSVPTTSNGSTTLPLTVGFQFNSNTTKWRCIGVA